MAIIIRTIAIINTRIKLMYKIIQKILYINNNKINHNNRSRMNLILNNNLINNFQAIWKKIKGKNKQLCKILRKLIIVLKLVIRKVWVSSLCYCLLIKVQRSKNKNKDKDRNKNKNNKIKTSITQTKQINLSAQNNPSLFHEDYKFLY